MATVKQTDERANVQKTDRHMDGWADGRSETKRTRGQNNEATTNKCRIILKLTLAFNE